MSMTRRDVNVEKVGLQIGVSRARQRARIAREAGRHLTIEMAERAVGDHQRAVLYRWFTRAVRRMPDSFLIVEAQPDVLYSQDAPDDWMRNWARYRVTVRVLRRDAVPARYRDMDDIRLDPSLSVVVLPGDD